MEWARFLQGEARSWAGVGIDLLFPPHCPICRGESVELPDGRRLSPRASSDICGPCRRDLSADVRRCPRCGSSSVDGAECRSCRRSGRRFDNVVVLSGYEGAVREAVLRVKRPGAGEVAVGLAHLLVAKHGDAMRSWQGDVVVPVPMHWWRRMLRGASAADELGAALAGHLGLRLSRVLVRRRATRRQNELPIADRARNVRRAFSARRRLDGKRVLLVDDVMTTGATLADCSRALREAGARAVDVAVIARADPQGRGDDGEER